MKVISFIHHWPFGADIGLFGAHIGLFGAVELVAERLVHDCIDSPFGPDPRYFGADVSPEWC